MIMERTCIDVDAFENSIENKRKCRFYIQFQRNRALNSTRMVVRLITNYTIAIVERVKATSIKL